MRFAPLKGDCIICQAPEPTRIAINAAIWPGESMIRMATYRQAAVETARESKVPGLAKINVKTVRRHVDHVEASWIESPPDAPLRADLVPVKGDFLSLVDRAGQLSGRALEALENMVASNPETLALLMTKEVISMAKLGLTATSAAEANRLKRNQQKIDVMAIFAASSGHLDPLPGAPDDDDSDSPPVEVLRAALTAERRLLTERATGEPSPLET